MADAHLRWASLPRGWNFAGEPDLAASHWADSRSRNSNYFNIFLITPPPAGRQNRDLTLFRVRLNVFATLNDNTRNGLNLRLVLVLEEAFPRSQSLTRPSLSGANFDRTSSGDFGRWP